MNIGSVFMNPLTLVMSISSVVMNLWAYRTDFGDGDCKCFHEFMGL